MSTQGRSISKEQAANYALHYVKQIRQNVLTLMEMVTEDVDDHKELERVFRRLEANYNDCEQAVQTMSDKMIVTDSLQKLALEYQEDFLPEEMGRPQNSKELFGKEKLESYLDSVNYLDTFGVYAHFNEQLIRLGASSARRRPMILDPRPLTFSTFTPHSNPHTLFLQAVQSVKLEALQKRHGIWLNILEQSAFGSLLEMKTGSVVDKQTIVSQKTLIVENNGTIDMLIFIAPHEEWRYLDQFGEYGGRKLDLMQRSQYLIYQKLTSIANQSLAALFAPSNDPREGPAQILMKNLHWLTKYQKIFETKCRICQKYMKDYLPCVMFDPRTPAMSMHESCR